MTYADALGRPIDAFGRPQLHNPLLGVLRAVPGLAGQFRVVPEGFFELGDTAQITCPCGAASHYVPRGGMVSCPGCARLYLLAGGVLRCAQSMSDEEWAAFQAEPLEA